MINFSKSKILVIGDLMVDKYIIGEIDGMSYEAPIPHIITKRTDLKMGGAGAIAENAAILGANTQIIGIVGKDEFGDWINKNIKKNKIKSKIISIQKNKTITRNRIISGIYQLGRFDDPSLSLNKKIERKIISSLKTIIPKVDVVVIADYNKGILSDNVIKTIKDITLKNKTQVIVATINNIEKYYESRYIFKIKYEDAIKIINKKGKISDKKICQSLHKILKSNKIIMTKGSEGVILFEEDGDVTNIPATHHKMRDPTSVGEILVSVVAVSLASGKSHENACILGNIASGIAVEKTGVKYVQKLELNKEFEHYLESSNSK